MEEFKAKEAALIERERAVKADSTTNKDKEEELKRKAESLENRKKTLDASNREEAKR